MKGFWKMTESFILMNGWIKNIVKLQIGGYGMDNPLDIPTKREVSMLKKGSACASNIAKKKWSSV